MTCNCDTTPLSATGHAGGADISYGGKRVAFLNPGDRIDVTFHDHGYVIQMRVIDSLKYTVTEQAEEKRLRWLHSLGWFRLLRTYRRLKLKLGPPEPMRLLQCSHDPEEWPEIID